MLLPCWQLRAVGTTLLVTEWNDPVAAVAASFGEWAAVAASRQPLAAASATATTANVSSNTREARVKSSSSSCGVVVVGLSSGRLVFLAQPSAGGGDAGPLPVAGTRVPLGVLGLALSGSVPMIVAFGMWFCGFFSFRVVVHVDAH